ncbi:MAG: RNA polymerase-associated protein RapA [Pseudomonadales bacterium]|nr:RNA polymerase-associated protein RapA [Pseudomonadales bacterium]
MSLLRDHDWRIRYTPEQGNLLELVYVPALRCAQAYDRTTGYFNARALTLAARGVEYLIHNGGRMRLIIGCTLDEPEVNAIGKGQTLRDTVEAQLLASPLQPENPEESDALALLAWMVARGVLETKVAVPCDAQRRPLAASGPLFHEKSGVFEDKTGDKIAFNGSLNETAAGWTLNWESLNVFRSWVEPERVAAEEESFARLWADRASRVITLDVPSAARQDLLRFLPADDRLPPGLQPEASAEHDISMPVVDPVPPVPPVPIVDWDERRRALWGYIREAAKLPGGGALVGEATAAVTPWPHQVRAFHRLYDQWPPRLLIADEVGLGKTIQAGLLLRQAWLAGRAGRILVMTPASVCKQWQIELREKFNLDWPIYDGHVLRWQSSQAQPEGRELTVSRAEWHRQPAVIVSSHLLRRSDRFDEVVNQAEPWDLVVLDEAHHARRRSLANLDEARPNALLRLMRELAPRAPGVVLLTATPMQVHPIEVWDLLSLLGLPDGWYGREFLDFFDLVAQPNPSHEALDRVARLFRAAERRFGARDPAQLQRRLEGVGSLRLRRVLEALRSEASIPRRMLTAEDRQLALRLARQASPVSCLISRHTRALLRRYHERGLISTRVASRMVEDRFLDMSPGEAALYAALEEYITQTYNKASQEERSAIGFVLTIYRRRLASSVRALVLTLEKHLQAVRQGGATPDLLSADDRDALESDIESADDADYDEAERSALAREEAGEIESLLRLARSLPEDTKLDALRTVLGELRAAGHSQVMVFTQFTDTMDLLRESLGAAGDLKLMCFSGRGGESRGQDGVWRIISRDETKRRFRQGEAHVLLCTDAAAEGLNFQFCGALVNYDMPWNPMRVEQRIGRIDRLGQRYPEIRIVNLHYEDSIEADVYRALGSRIDLFQSVVGKLQPILSKLPSLITARVLAGGARGEVGRLQVAEEVAQEAAEAEEQSFDLDEILEDDLVMPARPTPLLTLQQLGALIRAPELLPGQLQIAPLGNLDWSLQLPGMAKAVRVTTDREFFEEHAGSVELWSPGSPVFPEPEWADWRPEEGMPTFPA